MKHAPTETPWRASGRQIETAHEGQMLPYIVAKTGVYTLTPQLEREGAPEANAAFIVRACNAFDAMREALEEAEKDIRQRALPSKDWLEKARAALALANGETK